MDEVFTINQFAIQNAMPNLTLVFDIEPRKGLERISLNKDRERNRLDLEEIEFHEKVYEAYQLLVKRFPERIQVINADQSIEKVEEDSLSLITQYLNTME